MGGRMRMPTARPAAPTTPTRRPPGLDADLAETLEVACLDEMRGDPPGPGLAKRLERAVRDVLRAARIDPVAVRATSDRTGTRVTILLPRPDATVAEVVLTLG